MAVALRRRRIAIAVLPAAVAFAVAIAAAVWLLLRPSPVDVAVDIAKRFEERVATRFPGASTSWLSDDLARIALPSGLMLDVALTRVEAVCHSRPTACTDRIDQSIVTVDRVARLTQEPRADAVRAVIVGELAPGYRYGYITEPLIGALEIRYALADGDALTFMTPAIADRLAIKPAALRGLAIRQIERESADPSGPGVEALNGEPGVYVARSTGDAPSLLLAPERMNALAHAIGTPQLYCAIPRRGLLLLAKADAAGREALRRAIVHAVPPAQRAAFDGVLIYDSAAPSASALSALN